MDLAKIAVDPSKELHGAKVRLDGETTIVVARFNNTLFREKQAALMEPLIQTQGRKGVTTEQAEDILAECMAETILLGWEGLYIAGREIPYSKAVAMKILKDPRFLDFKERVMLEAQRQENYRLADLEDDLGNFVPSSITPVDGQGNNRSSSRESRKRSQEQRPQQAGQGSTAT